MEVTFVFVYNFVSSQNHIFVSCQHTTINFSKRYCFLGSFSSGFDKFSPTGLFQKLTKPFKGGWPCIDGFGYYFRVPWGCMKQWSVWWRFCALQKWQKNLYVQRKIFILNAIDQGISNTSKTLAVKECTYLNNAFGLQPDADHWGNSHHILLIWSRNQGNL